MKKSRTPAKPRLTGVHRAFRAASIFLREAGDFRLSFAIFGHPGRMAHWLEKLTEELAVENVHLTICNISTVENPRLIDALTDHLQELPTPPGLTRAVVVTGISPHLPDAAAPQDHGGAAPPFLAEANLDRELFPARCPHPLLLCVTQTAYAQFRRHAADLVHWSSHTFDFSETALPDGSRPIRPIAELQQAAPGTVYANRDEMITALGIFRSGLDAAIAAHGPDHRETVDVRANLANVLHQIGRTPEALDLARENLQIVEKGTETDDPEIAKRTSQLGYFLDQIGNRNEAEPLMREALRIRRVTSKKDDPHVAVELNNLAILLQKTNRLIEAETLMREALRIHRAVLGENHPRVDIQLSNLAQLLQNIGNFAEAEPLMRESLQKARDAYGSDNLSVSRELNNLGSLLFETNRLSEAEPLIREALRIFEACLGAEHPKTVTVARNLDHFLAELRRTPPEISGGE